MILYSGYDKGAVCAGVAELADARDLKSRGNFSRTGSIPVSGTKSGIY